MDRFRALMNVSRSGPKEQSSLVESFGSLRAQVLRCRWSIKVTKGSMMILKGERTVNLHKIIESIIVGDVSAVTEKDTARLWHMRLGHMSERALQALHNKSALPGIKYCKLSL